ncbi:hypothetical protein [Hyphomonas sp.]|uniref:hypothetical protein n=1 Tax=Hyphomonas sp. TaxID=87 RepID=UPI003297DA62
MCERPSDEGSVRRRWTYRLDDTHIIDRPLPGSSPVTPRCGALRGLAGVSPRLRFLAAGQRGS